VYKRVTPKNRKPGFFSTIMTFGTSAFWVSLDGAPSKVPDTHRQTLTLV
jgi:hypothetical protein